MMRSRWLTALLAALCMCARASVACAQRPPADRIHVEAGATLARDSVTVGDVVKLMVRVRAPRGATINFPAAVDSLGPVQSIDPPTVANGADTSAFTDRIATYRLAAWDVGLQPIRLGEVLVQTDEGERRVTLTLPSLFVRSVLPADTALRVPKPPRDLLAVPRAIPWWWWAIAAVVIVLILLLAWWLRRRASRQGESTGDPYLDAINAFERVNSMKLLTAGEPGQYAALMTDVTRRYLAERIDAASLAQTSTELIVATRSAKTVQHDRLSTLLNDVDAVKFAREPLTVDRAQQLGEAAKQIVLTEHERNEALTKAANAEHKAAA